MFLQSIDIQSFRGIEDLSLDFLKVNGDTSTRKWTIVLGENGTGKSNLLKAIALITGGSNVLGELLSNPSDWITYSKDFCIISAILQTTDKKHHKIELKINRGDQLGDVVRKNTKSLEVLDKAISEFDGNYFLVAYGAYRKLKDNKNLGSNGSFYENIRSRRVATLFNRDASLNSIEAWAMDLDYRKEVQGLKIVKDALDKFLPEVSFRSIDKKNKRLLFQTSDGIIPLEFLSDGYQNMAGWLGDLLYRIAETFENYESMLQAKGVLLIDELELHLHPLWQRKLVTYIEEMLPNFQIIATTHAPLTAQQSPENSLYFLKRYENRRLHLEAFVGNPRLLRVEQLIRTPAFGVSSVASFEVQQKKEAYRKLKNKKQKNPKEQRQYQELIKFLESIPNISAETPTQKKQLDLLEKIEEHLKTK